MTMSTSMSTSMSATTEPRALVDDAIADTIRDHAAAGDWAAAWALHGQACALLGEQSILAEQVGTRDALERCRERRALLESLALELWRRQHPDGAANADAWAARWGR